MSSIPNFAVCEKTGKYTTRRPLTGDQIIRAAKRLLAERVCRGQAIAGPADMGDYLVTHYSALEREMFACVYLSNAHRVITVDELFTGTIDECHVFPREIVRRALLLNAAAVILAHNHPSGNPKPSRADIRMTERVRQSLQTVDIRLLDHIVVAGGVAVSVAARKRA